MHCRCAAELSPGARARRRSGGTSATDFHTALADRTSAARHAAADRSLLPRRIDAGEFAAPPASREALVDHEDFVGHGRWAAHARVWQWPTTTARRPKIGCEARVSIKLPAAFGISRARVAGSALRLASPGARHPFVPSAISVHGRRQCRRVDAKIVLHGALDLDLDVRSEACANANIADTREIALKPESGNLASWKKSTPNARSSEPAAVISTSSVRSGRCCAVAARAALSSNVIVRMARFIKCNSCTNGS